MEKYDAWKFRKIYESKLGGKLWDFLNHHDNIIRMQTASDLRKPAVEALEKALRDFLSDKELGLLKEKLEYRQMIGHMVKQIMQANGYEKTASNVKLRSNIERAADGSEQRKANTIFQAGSRYRAVEEDDE